MYIISTGKFFFRFRHKSWTLFLLLILPIGFSILSIGFNGCKSKASVTLDLACDTAWELSIDDGPWRSIKVPGGGYNSDLQNQPLIDQEDVLDHVIYRRSITIPDLTKGM